MTDQLVAVVKRGCPTCTMIEPVLWEVAGQHPLVVHTQDDPSFPSGVLDVRHDETLEHSYRLSIETVPTLIRYDSQGRVIARTEGWSRPDWQEVTGIEGLGADLPEMQAGCGALNIAPGMPERLAVRFGDIELVSRRVEVSELDDPVEMAFDRGWSDGLPVTPPTDVRVVRMLGGTSRSPSEVIGRIPPNLAECTVEKVAVNAVMAGCRPEYIPTVLAAVEAALIPEFAMHGLLCTLGQAGPLVIVNGPAARRIGMNWGGNALGQGNRANATIGRALQPVIRNVGGGRPGEIDRAVLGHPGKYTYCFAEDETDPDWVPLSVARGFDPGASTVTLFHAEGGATSSTPSLALPRN